MKEKLLEQLKKAIEGKNLSNLSDKTISDYTEAVSVDVTDESQIDESLLSKHVAILTTLNGQYNADRAEDKRKYDAELEKFKKEYKPESQQQQQQTNPDNGEAKDEKYESLMAKITAMEKKEAEREALAKKQDLIANIKSKSQDKRFSTFVDNAHIDYDADADTNFATLNAAFEIVTKPEVDNGSVNVPNGVNSKEGREKFADLFPKKEN